MVNKVIEPLGIIYRITGIIGINNKKYRSLISWSLCLMQTISFWLLR